MREGERDERGVIERAMERGSEGGRKSEGVMEMREWGRGCWRGGALGEWGEKGTEKVVKGKGGKEGGRWEKEGGQVGGRKERDEYLIVNKIVVI